MRRVVPRAALLAALAGVSGRAQPPSRPATAPSGRTTTTCSGQRIDDVTVTTEAPSVANLEHAPTLARIARTLHVTTRPPVIRRFMLLDIGDACSELRRAESERILRAQPFIAEAAIYVIANDRGGVDLEVRTSDEAAMVIGGAERAKRPYLTSVLLGNANLAGEGVFASGWWRYGEGFRDGVGGRLIGYQSFGLPMVLSLEGERASLGGQWRVGAMRPFYTDLQRIAWRAQAGMSNGYVELRLPNGERPSVNIERTYFDVGGVARLGPPGRLTLFGLSLTGNDEASNDILIEGDSGFVRPLGKLAHPYPPHRVARANFLFGLRAIDFVRVEGLDAITGVQDLPLGLQFGGLIGRSIRTLGARNDDSFVTGDVYGGAMTDLGITRLELRGEARRALGADHWDGILTSGRLRHTVQISTRHLNQSAIEWAGAYGLRTPFQLLLGVPDGGVRGYESSVYAGAQRLVVRTEERFSIGQLLHQADGGLAIFADAGRQWAGDAPFGITTSLKAAVGFGILAAIPPRSTRVWRADAAFPITSGAARRWEISLTSGDRARFAFKEPRDVSDFREPTVPSSIFAWP